MKLKLKYGMVFMMCIIFGTAAFTEPVMAQNKNQKNLNHKTKIFVEYKLIKKGLLDNNNINVNVKNNVITLKGIVPTIKDRKEAECIAKDVNEKYTVKNNINIAPADVADSVVTANVLHNIYDSSFYNVFDYVTASDNNGVVTLNGWVTYPWYKRAYQKQAEKIVGVKRVVNKIENTFGPGELGYRIRRIIYDNPFSPFAGMQYFNDPPVHIIVNNGNVILAGSVDSPVLRSWAANTVLFNTNAISVKDYLQINNS